MWASPQPAWVSWQHGRWFPTQLVRSVGVPKRVSRRAPSAEALSSSNFISEAACPHHECVTCRNTATVRERPAQWGDHQEVGSRRATFRGASTKIQLAPKNEVSLEEEVWKSKTHLEMDSSLQSFRLLLELLKQSCGSTWPWTRGRYSSSGWLDFTVYASFRPRLLWFFFHVVNSN